jgi:hypothetical protein
MSQENVAVVRQAVEAFLRNDGEALQALCTYTNRADALEAVGLVE